MTQLSSSTELVWHTSDIAKKTDLCYLCDRSYKAGETIAFFGVPGPQRWSKGHYQCAIDDPRMIEKPVTKAPMPIANQSTPTVKSGAARMIVDEHPGKYSNKYLVLIGDEHLYTETSKARAEGAVSGLNALFAKQDKPI